MTRPPSDGPLAAGARVGPYMVESLLGEGGMGAVYLARHAETGARVALKVLHEHAVDDQVEVSRFRREAEILARLEKHPGIVRVHAFGADDGIAWCAMERVEGESLADVIRSGPVPPDRAARVVAQVARAIAFVHRHGVLHRDLKPGNILIGEDDRPRVVDFGLAHDAFSDRLTRTGEIIGTPVYMAPEQVSIGAGDAGLEISERTDVYGLGAVLYAALTGRGPFEASGSRSTMVAVVTRDPKPPRHHVPGVPAELEAICLHAMEKVPAHRYESAIELAADLERWLSGEPVSATSTGQLASVFRRLRWHGRSKRTVFVAGALAGLATCLLLIAIVGVPFAASRREAPVAVGERLVELEGRLERAGEVPLDAVDDLCARADAAGDAGARRRATLLRALARAARDGRDEVDLRVLAAAVRPAGELDGVALRRAEALLLGRADAAALDVVLHGAEPIAAASADAAPIVAAWLAEPGHRAPPPDEPAFAALLGARGVDGATRAALLVRRGEATLAAAGDAASRGAAERAALADWRRAWAEHGVAAPASAWTSSARSVARAAFVEAVVAGRTDEARALLDLLVRGGAGGDDLAPETVAGLQAALEEAAAAIVVERRLDDVAVERAVLAAALLEQHGLSPMSREAIEKTWGGLTADRIRARAEQELALPKARRNASVLLVLARMLQFGQAEDLRARRELTRPWIDAALATGIDEPRLLVQVAWLLERLGAADAGRPHALRALELDRARPDEARSPLIAERSADILGDLQADRAAQLGRGVDESERPAIAQALREAGAVALEAWRVQRAVEPRVARIVEAGGSAPAPLVRHAGVLRQVCDIAETLVGLGEPYCDEEDAKPCSATELMETALSAQDALATARVHKVRADHAWAHRDGKRSVSELADAIERLTSYLESSPDAWNFQHRWLVQYRTSRGDRLRALGDRDAALVEIDAALARLEAWPESLRAAVRQYAAADVAHGHRRRATLLRELGRGEEAEKEQALFDAWQSGGRR